MKTLIFVGLLTFFFKLTKYKNTCRRLDIFKDLKVVKQKANQRNGVKFVEDTGKYIHVPLQQRLKNKDPKTLSLLSEPTRWATQWVRDRSSTASSREALWSWPSTPSSRATSRRQQLSVSRSFLPPATASSLTTAITTPSTSSSKMASVPFPLSLSLSSLFLAFDRSNLAQDQLKIILQISPLCFVYQD